MAPLIAKVWNRIEKSDPSLWALKTFGRTPLRELPRIDVARTVALDRCAYDGYQRGWGLEFGSLFLDVWRDPLYQKARRAAVGRSTVMEQRRMNIYLLVRFFFPKLRSKNIIEFGAWRGGNALFMAILLRELYPDARVFALDTFEGMPVTDKRVDAHNAGDFGDVNLDEIRATTSRLGLANIEFVKGRIEDTAEDLYARTSPFALAHIDVDLYSAVKFAQDSVWQQIVPGGYIVYDDATVSSCIGATQAVEELIIERKAHCEQIWPHFVFRAPPVLQ